MKTAMVTFVVGARYQADFDKYCRKRAEAYCRRHGYDLIVVDQPIRELEGKKYTWQKLLLPESVYWSEYDVLCYFDADILIAKDAPQLPEIARGKIGGVPDQLPYQMNGGVMVFQTCPEVADAFGEALQNDDPFWEQKALTRVMLHRWMDDPMDGRFNRQFYFRSWSLWGSLLRRQWFYHACHGKRKMPFLSLWLKLTFR